MPFSTSIVIEPLLWPQGVVVTLAIVAEGDGTVTWAGFDVAGFPLGSGTFVPAMGQLFQSGDVTVLGDHVLVTVARSRGFHVWKLRGALGDALSLEEAGVDEDLVAGAQNLGSYDGARVSVVAARNRVLVAWITRAKPGAGDPTGGYALYSCGP